MKKIILALSLIFAGQAFALGTITIHGESAFSLANELSESASFSCDLNPAAPKCVIKTEIIKGKAGKVIFSGEVAIELQQIPQLDGILCSIFANLKTYCQFEPRPEFSFDEGSTPDEFQKIDTRGFSVKVK